MPDGEICSLVVLQNLCTAETRGLWLRRVYSTKHLCSLNNSRRATHVPWHLSYTCNSEAQSDWKCRRALGGGRSTDFPSKGCSFPDPFQCWRLKAPFQNSTGAEIQLPPLGSCRHLSRRWKSFWDIAMPALQAFQHSLHPPCLQHNARGECFVECTFASLYWMSGCPVLLHPVQSLLQLPCHNDIEGWKAQCY